MKKIIALLFSFCLFVCPCLTSFAEEASSEALSSGEVTQETVVSTVTMLNDFSDISTVAPDIEIEYALSADSPDGSCLKVGYEYMPILTVQSTVEKVQRAADADKNYLCFWIKTPYTNTDSTIFLGLIENSIGDRKGEMEMLWNGNSQENFYVGKIITVSKNGDKEYIQADRYLRLKPGFEGYVAIPFRSAMDIHPGWTVDKRFDYTSISAFQIWFEKDEYALDTYYYFDNFCLAKDENAFISMVENTGLTVSAPQEAESKPDGTESETGSSTHNETESVSSQAIPSQPAVEEEETPRNDRSDNITLFIIVIAVAVFFLATSIVFIYKPSFIFKSRKNDIT